MLLSSQLKVHFIICMWVCSLSPFSLNCPFPSDECQTFEDWLQDAQLAVNECFENPEMREDVEAFMQRLQVSKPVIPAGPTVNESTLPEQSDLRIQQCSCILINIPCDICRIFLLLKKVISYLPR